MACKAPTSAGARLRGQTEAVLVSRWSDGLTSRDRGPLDAFGAQGTPRRICPTGLSSALTVEAIFQIVKSYGASMNVTISPHDLRRTFAKLAHRGRAGLEQIQFSLGHESIVTTEAYIGARQDLADAPCDHLGLHCDGGRLDHGRAREQVVEPESSLRNGGL